MMPKLVDTHTHLNFSHFEKNWQKIAETCLKENIWLINVGCSLKTSKKAVEIANYFEGGVFAAVGVHPAEIKKEKIDFEKFLELAKEPKAVAIGEVGFDFWHEPFGLEEQKKVLKSFIEIAQEVKKPVIFHLRSSKDKSLNAYQVLIGFLEKENFADLKGVVHSFEGSIEEGEVFLKKGFYLGANGLINLSKKTAKVFKKLPLERIILETDAPYLKPPRAKGEINTPCNVVFVADKLARLKKVEEEKIFQITTKNARELFDF